MSDHPNIDKLKEYTESLLELLNDPHPGLFTWREMLAKRLADITAFVPLKGMEVVKFRDPDEVSSERMANTIANMKGLT